MIKKQIKKMIKIIFILKAFVLLAIASLTKAKFYAQECATSCAKSGCQMVTNPTCNFPPPTFDQNTSIGAMKCKQCTQSKDGKCLKDNIKKNFAVGGTNVTAVYCNDEYLVVWSLGMPNHETHMEYIPRPPGGQDLPYDQSI